MKKTFILALAALAFAACEKNKETKVESEETIIETKGDTVSVDTDTVAAAEAQDEADGSAVAQTPAVAKAGEKEVKLVPAAKEVAVNYASFGDKIAADKAITKDEMLKKYKALKPGDTVAIKFKDYAFFVPLNAAAQEAIVSGKAFVSETSVAQLRHYAKDGGKSDAEIAQITEPQVEYKFMADGVLISK
jgi:hypothetical protein